MIATGNLLVVVGGGAAGFFCAINAARLNPDLKVIIVEKTTKLLSKVKISGGGRCNVTHACFDIAEMSKRYPRGQNFVKKTFYQFEHRRLPMDSYKKGIITDISQVGGYPEYKGKPYVDTDKDGMPDAWEKKYGLNPNDPSDAQGDLNGDGYTNIEDYINGVNPAIKVDWKDLANNKETLVRPLLDLK